MDHVNYYAKRGDGTSVLQDRTFQNRGDLPAAFGPKPDSAFHVAEAALTRRVLKTELLPPEILNDPRFWEEAPHQNGADHRAVSTLTYLRPGGSEKPVDPFRYRC